MIRWMLHKRIAEFEKRWTYDSSYLHRIAEVSPLTAVKVALLRTPPPPPGLPVGPYAATKITATMAADCGSCLSLAREMGEEQGFPRSEVEAVLAGNEAAMDADVRLGYRFATAVLERDLEACQALGAEIRARWGEEAHLAMAMAVATASLYPSLKRSLALSEPGMGTRLAA
jgi:hypothetical protein